MFRLGFAVLAVQVVICIADLSKLEEVFAWKQVTYVSRAEGGRPVAGDFAFPEPASGNVLDESDAEFIQYNNVPMGVDRWKDKVFVTMPRRRHGIPSTLNYLSLSKDTNVKNPPLRPYPNYESNTLTNNEVPQREKLVSVYRTRVDVCDRLWMVDTGLLEIPDARQQVRTPSIVIFDLNTDTVIDRYEFQPGDWSPTSTLASITIDVTKEACDDAFAYVPDLSAYTLVVFSLKERNSWRINHNYFYLNPLAGDYDVAGLRFQWTDGIFSAALTPVHNGNRFMVFHAMSGTHEFAVSTRVLKNQTLALRSFHENDFMVLGDRGPRTQTSMSAMDPVNGILFYAQVGRNAVGCWNSQKAFTRENHAVLAQDDQRLLYPSDMDVDQEGNLWVIANSMLLFIYRELDTSIENFFIYRANVNDIVAGTPCANSRSRPNKYRG